MLYSFGMSVTVPLTELRPVIGKRVDAAHYTDEATVITKNGQPHAAIVSYAMYRQLTAATPNDSPLIHQELPENT